MFGAVRYIDGTAVWRAKVWTDAGITTFSDVEGRYAIVMPANGGSVTLFARDGYTPGVVYVVTHSGSVRIGGSFGRTRRDIVLDNAQFF